MRHPHTVFVCTKCGNKEQARQNAGERLLEELQNRHSSWSLQDDFSIQAVECMGVCEQYCVIAFASPGKHTYLFGSLPIDAGQLEKTTTAVLDCASQYHAQSDGFLSYSKRPALMKKGAIARIPPVFAIDSSENH